MRPGIELACEENTRQYATSASWCGRMDLGGVPIVGRTGIEQPSNRDKRNKLFALGGGIERAHSEENPSLMAPTNSAHHTPISVLSDGYWMPADEQSPANEGRNHEGRNSANRPVKMVWWNTAGAGRVLDVDERRKFGQGLRFGAADEGGHRENKQNASHKDSIRNS
jgi:hypothetical protein